MKWHDNTKEPRNFTGVVCVLIDRTIIRGVYSHADKGIELPTGAYVDLSNVFGWAHASEVDAAILADFDQRKAR